MGIGIQDRKTLTAISSIADAIQTLAKDPKGFKENIAALEAALDKIHSAEKDLNDKTQRLINMMSDQDTRQQVLNHENEDLTKREINVARREESAARRSTVLGDEKKELARMLKEATARKAANDEQSEKLRILQESLAKKAAGLNEVEQELNDRASRLKAAMK